jgi:poly(3-hydroxybutyrate) depolymerase
MILHGDRDRIIPIDGGRRRDRDYPQEYVPAEDAVRYWRRANRDDANVRFIRLRDWGHVWPGGPATRDLPADHPLHGFDAAEVIWEFFREHAAQKFQ